MRCRFALAALVLLTGCSTSPAHIPRTHGPASSVTTQGTPSPVGDFRVVSASRVGTRIVVMVAGGGCCYRLYRSGDGGRSWVRTRAPRRLGPTARVAFADAGDGWLMNAGTLFTTTDGGRHWSPSPLRNVRALAAIDGYGYLLAAGSLYVAGPGVTRFDRVAPSTADTLVASAGAVVAFDSVPRLGGASGYEIVRGRQPATGRLPCAAAWSQAVAVVAGDLLALCGAEPGTGNQLKHGFLSTDAGRTWRHTGAPGQAGYVEMGAACGSRAFYTGDRMSLGATSDLGRGWYVAVRGSGTAGGMAGLGFVDGLNGWAVDDGPPSALYLTDDCGRTWRTASRAGLT